MLPHSIEDRYSGGRSLVTATQRVDFAENRKTEEWLGLGDASRPFIRQSQIWPYATSNGTYQELIAAGEIGAGEQFRPSGVDCANYYVTGDERLARRVNVIPG